VEVLRMCLCLKIIRSLVEEEWASFIICQHWICLMPRKQDKSNSNIKKEGLLTDDMFIGWTEMHNC